VTDHVLITGGAGFIGSQLARRLVTLGRNVRVLDNLSAQIHGDDPANSPLYRSIEDRVEFIRGGVTSPDDLRRALRGARIVVHLAAETGTGQSMYAIRRYSDVNVGGTALLLDLIANEPFPVEKIIVASSRAIYGEGKYRCPRHGFVFPGTRAAEAMAAGDFEIHCPSCGSVASVVPTDEDSPPSPASVYGITKLNQEQLVLTVAKSLGIPAVAFRYQNVFGPGQSLTNPYTGILSIFSTRIRNGSGINIFEDGKESRDFVFIDDVVEATVRAIERDTQSSVAFNVGSGVATDVVKVAEVLQSLLGVSVPLEVSGRFRAGDIRHNVADLTRIRGALGFEPAVSFEEGMRRFVEWVRTRPVEPDGYERSIEELREKGLFK
jgi:dTDP-L-rhamnose 4-epimerase